MYKNLYYSSNNEKWHYIDLDVYAEEIRNSERSKALKRRRANLDKIWQKKHYNKKRINCLIIQKIIGIILTVVTMLICNSSLLYDQTTGCSDIMFAVILLPISLYLILTNKCLFDIKMKMS